MNAVVICWPVEDMPVPPAPSTKVPCYKCGREVWLSNITAKTVSMDKRVEVAEPLCRHCGKAVIKQGGEIQRPSPEQIADIEARTGTKLTEEDISAIIRRLKEMGSAE